MMKNVNSPRTQQKFRLHPLIHTFGSRKDTTTYGGGSKRARVWIKVCNIHSVEKLNEVVLPVPLYIAFFRFWLATELLVSIP